MLIPLVLLLSTGSLLSVVESHQSLNVTSNRQYSRQDHQSNIPSHHSSSSIVSSSSTTTGLGHGHPTAVARRNLQHQHQQLPSHSSNKPSSLSRRYWPSVPHQSHSPPSSSFLERPRRPLYRGPRAEPDFLDILETSPQEIRIPPGPMRSHSHPPPPPRRHNRQLGQNRPKTEIAITELKDISQIPKILRLVKDRIQSMPGLKAFLLTKDGPSSPKIKPSIVLTTPDDFSNKPGHLIWRLLNSKSAKSPNGFGKSLTSLSSSRPRYPSPPPPPPPSSSSPGLPSPPPPQSPVSSPPSSSTPSSVSFADKYTFIEVPSNIDLDGTSFSESTFPSENLVLNTSPESTESTPEEILIEQSDNQMTSNGLTSYNNNNNANNNHLNSFNGPIQAAESSSEMIEELPRTYYYRDTTEPKGYHHGGGSVGIGYHHHSSSDYLQATSSIRDNSFAISPFTINEHVPLSPKHNGWVPKDSKHWTPGAYRSAFYTPDTRLIKFTIHDRVSGSNPGKSSLSSSLGRNSAINKGFNNNNFNSANNNNNNVNSNVNSNINSNNNNNVNSNNYHLFNTNSLSNSKYSNDYINSQPSVIEESYNINEDELIRTPTTTSTISSGSGNSITSTTTTTTTHSPSTVNKIAPVVSLTPAPVTESPSSLPSSSSKLLSSLPESSSSSSSSTSSSHHEATATEASSLTTIPETTIKPSSH